MLGRRQINVQQDNLASMCRISVKALLDYACLYTHVDDECEEFINFCAVFEQMVSHRLRPNQKKVWLPGPGSPRHFWDVLMDTQSRNLRNDSLTYFQSCVPNIDAIESFKSPMAKLRAFIRVALMEKRLSDYILWVLDHQDMLRHHYLDGAVMLSEQASVLCGDLIGLNAIDFNFCLKGNENEFLGPLEISYSGFLRYKQTAASRNRDEIEMLRLNKAEDLEEDQDSVRGPSPGALPQAGGVLTEGDVNDILRLQQLERDFYSIKEQKDYLEELTRLRERQVAEANARLDNLKAEMMAQQKTWERERHTMDSCILELQADITKLYQQNERQRFQLASYKQFKDRLVQREVQMDNMALLDTSAKSRDSPKPQASPGSNQHHQQHRRQDSHHSSDRLSTTGSFQGRAAMGREDSQSMVPLTGSLADVNVAMLDSGSKDMVQKRFSQWETGAEEDQGSCDVEEAQNALVMQSETNPVFISGASGGQPEAATGHAPAEMIMMESFVVTGEKGDVEQAMRQALASHGGDAADIVDVSVVAVEAPDDEDVVEDVGEFGDGDDVDDGIDMEEDADADVPGPEVMDGGEEDEYDDVVREVEYNEQHDVTAAGLEDNVDENSDVAKTEDTDVKSMEAKEDEPPVTAAVETHAEAEDEVARAPELDPSNDVDEPKEQVVFSDPEVVDAGNTSSDGSDGAWDMVSDTENPADGKGEEQ